MPCIETKTASDAIAANRHGKPVLVAVSNHGHMLGGGEHSFLDLLPAIHSQWQPVALVPAEAELAVKLRQRNIDTRMVPLPPLRPWNIGKMVCSLLQIIQVSRAKGASLLYANGSRAAVYAGISGRLLGVPVVWHCRVAEPDPCLDNLLVRLCTMIIANSRATAGRFARLNRSTVRVVYNGINTNWFNEPDIQKPDSVSGHWRVILVVARLSKWKRHDIVISAFERIAQVDPDAHLISIGAIDDDEPEWWNRLRQRSHSSEFSDRIHWIGHADDVRSWYRVAKVMVLASDNEPFGRVVVEAMAAGVPVVAANSGGVPEIVHDGVNGLLFEPRDPMALSEKISQIFEDAQLRSRIISGGIDRSKHFTLKKQADRTMAVFGEAARS